MSLTVKVTSHSLVIICTACIFGFHFMTAATATADETTTPPPTLREQEIEHLRTYITGLEAHKFLLRTAILPTPADIAGFIRLSASQQIEFWEMLRSLGEISEQQKKVSSLLVLTENQDSVELRALQAVFDKLVENACSLLNLKVDDVECSFNELKKLKLKIEALTATETAISLAKSAFRMFEGESLGRNFFRNWIRDVLVCDLSTPEQLELVNRALARSRKDPVTQEHCDAK